MDEAMSGSTSLMKRRSVCNIIIPVLLTLMVVLVNPVLSHAGKETKRVLILCSQEKWLPVHELTEQGLRAVFRESPSFDIQLYVEYLDEGRFPGPSHASVVADYLRRKYEGTEINAIIAVYAHAVDFLLAERRTLFPGVPIIAAEVFRGYAENLEHLPVRRFVTGTIMGDNVAGVLDAALRMRPATKRVALVAGTSPNDVLYAEVFRKALRPYAGTLELIDLTKLSMEETLLRVRSLSPDTIVLYSSIFRDGAGKSFVPREALSLIAPAANAPVFSLYAPYLGYGIVGGRLVSIEQHGREAAALALRILSGESPGGIPFGGEQAYVNQYDWRELKRWGIPETAVPAGGVILYRQHSLWEEHRSGILGVIFLIIIEGLLILGLTINLRMRRKAERSLRESETRMTLTAEAAGVGVWMWTFATNRVWGSEQALRLFGFEPGADVSYEMAFQRIHPDDRERVESAVRHAMETGAGYTSEYRVMLPDGTARWIAARGRMHPDPQGKPARMLGVVVDISERKYAQQELAKKSNELSHLSRVTTLNTLSNSLAHELNQPLGAILRNAEAAEMFLQAPSPDLEEVRAILSDIRKDDQRAGEVIDRMRSQLKQHEVEYSLLDLNLLAGEVLELVRPEADSRKIGLALETGSSHPAVRGDQVQLQQVLLNLLLNAMDAVNDSAPDGRRVIVSVQTAGPQVEVAVSDTGHGISEDKLARVFDPFFTTKPDGLGMGLAISHDIIEAHGGRLWAKNNEKGGATFTVTLPAAVGGDTK
jgi:PAS domain S-box-containing protein